MADYETTVAPVVEPELEENKENKENQVCDGKESAETELNLAEMKLDSPPSADIDKVTADLLQSRSDILGRVQNLKKDLQEWRGKLDSQVKTYRQELGELRSTLNSEVEQLRDEFQALRSTLKRQLDATTGLSELGPDSSPEKVNDVKENVS
ncbi:hypothetical protein Mapa_015819 [Marchantia paleacea]|nr:hypothetical protein Mapa_015819 [Marchantia paleacea]